MKRKSILERLERRTVLRGAGAAALGGSLVGSSLADRGRESEEGIVVEQGDRCVPIEPLRGTEDIVTMYGYEPDETEPNPRQSNFPSKLEAEGTSRFFFYDGPGGRSIVLLQGGGEDDPGGAASFLVCGLPIGGNWAVLDDDYGGASDEFLLSPQEAVLHWAWGVQGRNDGAVFRGFSDVFCVSIKPTWDEAAKLEAFNGDGGVENWQVLSGDFEDPDVIDLDPEEPITVRSGDCGDESEGCPIATTESADPIDATVTFCCNTVLIDADTYDSVSLELLDGSDQQFSGPFQGLRAFLTEDDSDGNPHDEIIRSVEIEAGRERATIENPGFSRCRETAKDDNGDEDDGRNDGY